MKKIKFIAGVLFTLVFCIVNIMGANAQLNNFQSTYFQNQYSSNPAMAGLEKGLNINLGYQQQWTGTPGGPKLQAFTADYRMGEKVGLGIIFNNDQAGLISRTKVMGTYAYHLPLSTSSKLNFGLSLGFTNNYLDYSKIVGDQYDNASTDYNQRKVNFDGDLGISYTDKALTVQGAIPNLRTALFSKNDDETQSVDRATFYTAASYKIPLTSASNIEPKIALRGIKGFDNIFDAGFNFNLHSGYGINLLGLYHSNKSETVGFGLDLNTIDILFTYTNSTSQLQGYGNNTFEAGLKFRFFNNK